MEQIFKCMLILDVDWSFLVFFSNVNAAILYGEFYQCKNKVIWHLSGIMCITVWSVNYNILEFSLVKQMFCICGLRGLFKKNRWEFEEG